MGNMRASKFPTLRRFELIGREWINAPINLSAIFCFVYYYKTRFVFIRLLECSLKESTCIYMLLLRSENYFSFSMG